MSKTIGPDRDWRPHWADTLSRTPPGEFLAQVGYTINRRAVGLEQIDMVEAAIQRGLNIGAGDVVLDLCCGNGLVTRRLGNSALRVYGVDFSESLIAVARDQFAAANISYICCPATDLTRDHIGGDRITKIVMASALQYFNEDSMATVMRRIGAITDHGVAIYCTDIPDVDHLYDFYDTPERRAELARRQADGTEAIGTWWNREALTDLIDRFGYAAEIVVQDPARHRASYRFDLVARPRRA